MDEVNSSIVSSTMSGNDVGSVSTDLASSSYIPTAETYILESENISQTWDVIKTTAQVISKEMSTRRTTTAEPYDEFGPPEGIEYIFVPLGVMIFVIVLSAVVLIISRKRKMERLRHRLMPLYNFDPGEEGEDDWETELLEEGFNTHQRRPGYQSMDSEDNAELFGRN